MPNKASIRFRLRSDGSFMLVPVFVEQRITRNRLPCGLQQRTQPLSADFNTQKNTGQVLARFDAPAATRQPQ